MVVHSWVTYEVPINDLKRGDVILLCSGKHQLALLHRQGGLMSGVAWRGVVQCSGMGCGVVLCGLGVTCVS